jgi:four helix bundle protein
MAGERNPIRSYEDLRVWQRGISLADATFRSCRHFPIEGRSLAEQMRRAAVSVPSNLAEGWGRGSKREFLRYLSIARGSLLELRTQVEIARRAGFLSNEDASRAAGEVDEISRMLLAYRRSLRSRGAG